MFHFNYRTVANADVSQATQENFALKVKSYTDKNLKGSHFFLTAFFTYVNNNRSS